MVIFSLIINVILFFTILNWNYIKNKRKNPDFPDKPFTKLVLFPLALGVVFTLIVDVFKGIVFYQLIIFLVVAILLYWIFYKMKT